MRAWSPLFIVLALFILAGVFAGEAAAARSCAGAPVVQSASRSFMAAARRGSAGAFSRALSRHVHLKRLALFALGRYRRKMSASQRRAYLRLLPAYVARKLSRYSGGFGGGAVEVVKCRRNVVETRLKPGGGRVLWRLSGRRIVDVNIHNMWLGMLLRDHVRDLIRSVGGDISAFLARLR